MILRHTVRYVCGFEISIPNQRFVWREMTYHDLCYGLYWAHTYWSEMINKFNYLIASLFPNSAVGGRARACVYVEFKAFNTRLIKTPGIKIAVEFRGNWVRG